MKRGRRLSKEDVLKMDGKKVIVYDKDYEDKDVIHTVKLKYNGVNHDFTFTIPVALVDSQEQYYDADEIDEEEVYELLEDDETLTDISNLINCTVDSKEITLPKYETVCASGMDIRAYKFALPNDLKTTLDFPYTLKPFERVLVKSGLHIELPRNTEAQIRPRSGLALKHGISIVNSPGTIDEDFKGEIGVVLINMSDENFTINKGDRIAQMVFQKVEKFNLNIVDKLSKTVRGQGGFNSTGVK